jgi:hypothetical protein
VNLSNVIIAILFLVIIVVAFFAVSSYFRYQERKLFNKGNCIECQIPLEKVGNHGKIKVYYCPKCHSMLAFYYNIDKGVQLNNFKMTEDEDEETVDSTVVA